MKPKHIHDCDGCQYIHTVKIRDNDVDWYYCKDACGGSLIGRNSDEGSNYWSAPLDVIENIRSLGSKHMQHAKELVQNIKKGLINV